MITSQPVKNKSTSRLLRRRENQKKSGLKLGSAMQIALRKTYLPCERAPDLDNNAKILDHSLL